MNRIYYEDCTVLRAPQFFGVRNGNYSLPGPINIGGRVTAKNITALWCWHGKRYGQAIKRIWLPTKQNGKIPWFICPGCETKRHRLYLPPGWDSFYCRDCLNLQYGAWRCNAKYRHPRDPVGWLKWLDKRATEVVKGVGTDNKI